MRGDKNMDKERSLIHKENRRLKEEIERLQAILKHNANDCRNLIRILEEVQITASLKQTEELTRAIDLVRDFVKRSM